jgi:hypothetical protein
MGEMRIDGDDDSAYGIESVFRNGSSDIIRRLERILDTQSIPVTRVFIQTTDIDL